MKEENDYALRRLNNSLDRLKEGIAQVQNELDRDSVIKRFEFTFESLWKTIKIFLEYKGIRVNTPRDCFKEAFKREIIDNQETILKILEDRNLTSHIYDENMAIEVYTRIKNSHIPVIENILHKLQRISD